MREFENEEERTVLFHFAAPSQGLTRARKPGLLWTDAAGPSTSSAVLGELPDIALQESVSSLSLAFVHHLCSRPCDVQKWSVLWEMTIPKQV